MSRRLAQTYHNLSQLLGAGVPVLRAFDTVSAQPGRLGAVLKQMRQAVRSGDTIADAMRSHRRVFADFDIGVVAVGEESGALPERLEQLGAWYDFIARMKGILISGLVYPLFVLHVGALLAPVPSFILGSSGASGYIRAVLTILALVYIPLLAAIAFVKLQPRRGSVRLVIDRCLLAVPVLGGALEKLAFSRFTHAFHIACKAGIPPIRCMEMALNCTQNEALAARLAPGLQSAREGQDISTGFSDQIPLDYRQIWQVGEETGDLDDVTARLARQTAESAELRLTELARWLPRIVYFFIMAVMAYHIFRGYAQIAATYR